MTEGNAPIITIQDLSDPSLYRINSIISFLYGRLGALYGSSAVQDLKTNVKLASARVDQASVPSNADELVTLRTVRQLIREVSGGTGQTGNFGISLGIAAKNADYTLLDTDYTVVVDTTAGNVTIKLPTGIAPGRIYNIKKTVAANSLIIDGNGNTIDGSATLTVTAINQNTMVQFLTGVWYVL